MRHSLRHPTLELDWLPMSVRKGLDQPRIVVTDCKDYCGAYWPREYSDRPSITPFDFDLREGAVIEMAAFGDASTLAHEYRHHWQCHGGCNFYGLWNPADNSTDAHWKEIRRFFTEYWWERDALIFESKLAPDDLNMERMDFLGWTV